MWHCSNRQRPHALMLGDEVGWLVRSPAFRRTATAVLPASIRNPDVGALGPAETRGARRLPHAAGGDRLSPRRSPCRRFIAESETTPDAWLAPSGMGYSGPSKIFRSAGTFFRHVLREPSALAIWGRGVKKLAFSGRNR